MSGWLAGVATDTLVIPPGTILGGYADRSEPSRGTADALEISALVLQAGTERLHLVTADLIAVDPDLVQAVAAAAGIPPESLIFAVSHTHSGPLGVPQRLHPASPETVAPSLRQHFMAVASGVLRRACTQLTPVTISHGDVRVQDAWSNRNDPNGPSDERVRVMAVRKGDSGALYALVVLVPSHPTILGATNLLASADLHGGIRRALRRLGSIDTPILTLTGAAGDISTRYTRHESSFAEVDRIGDMVAERSLAVLPDLAQIAPILAHRSRNVMLSPRQIDRAEAVVALTSATASWEEIERNPLAGRGERRSARTRLQGAEIQASVTNLAPMEVPIAAWRLGDELTLATIPGELFTSPGRRIERETRPYPAWVVGYANGYAGYLVDQEAEQSGTYEALASPWSATTSEEVIDAAIGLVADLPAGDDE